MRAFTGMSLARVVRMVVRERWTHPLMTVFVGCLGGTLGCSGEDWPAESNETIGSHEQQIVGGTEATPGAWPSVVSVVYDLSPVWPWWCGGTLIGDSWVLTAAHCVYGDLAPSRYEVYIGRHDIESTDGQVVAVDQIIMHPNPPVSPEPGDGVGGDNDFALLRLATSVTVPVSRLAAPARLSEIVAGDATTILGWGDLVQGGASSPTLQQVTLDVIGFGNDCNSVSAYTNVTNNELCIGTLAGGQDSCQGDSGGPVYVSRDNEWFLLAVTSWGFGCAQPNQPGVYAAVPRSFDWIRTTATGSPAQSLLPSAQIITVVDMTG